MTASDVAVLLFGDRRVPRPLKGLRVQHVGGADDIDGVAGPCRRLVVVGGDSDLGEVLTRLLRRERLDVEVGFVSLRRSAATRAYRLATGRRAARRARAGTPRPVPLIRDDTGAAIAGSATWRGPDNALHGEAVVDDTTLFDGDAAGVRVEPTGEQPGLRAAVLSPRGRPRGWVVGRAAQLGTTGAVVERDGVVSPRRVRRSTFYRHIEGWLLVR